MPPAAGLQPLDDPVAGVGGVDYGVDFQGGGDVDGLAAGVEAGQELVEQGLPGLRVGLGLQFAAIAQAERNGSSESPAMAEA